MFLCHQGPLFGRTLVCRGWLSVHPDCIAVRLALINGEITVEQRDAEVVREDESWSDASSDLGLLPVGAGCVKRHPELREYLIKA